MNVLTAVGAVAVATSVAWSGVAVAAPAAEQFAPAAQFKNGALITDALQIYVRMPVKCLPTEAYARFRVVSMTPSNPADSAAAAKWAAIDSGSTLTASADLTDGISPKVEGHPEWRWISSTTSLSDYGMENGGAPLVPGEYKIVAECYPIAQDGYNLQHAIIKVTGTGAAAKAEFINPNTTTFPAAPAGIDTTTTVVADPATVVAPAPLTLKATITSSDPTKPAVGKVKFSVDNGATWLGPVDVAGGKAEFPMSTTVAGSYQLKAEFVPTDAAAFKGSTGTGSLTVTGPSQDTPLATTVETTLTKTGVAGEVKVENGVKTADATKPAVGKCTLFINGVEKGQIDVAAGKCGWTVNSVDFAVDNTFKTVFTPTDATAQKASEASKLLDKTYPGGGGTGPAPDPQTITVDIPNAGGLMISTPYTPENPLALGQAVISSDGTTFSASKLFDKVTVTDSRTNNPGWVASLQRTDFVMEGTPANKIPAKHSGFTGVTPHYLTGNAVTNINVFDIPAGSDASAPAKFASADATKGKGSVDIKANFELKDVPSSTPAGKYVATVVFTVA